MKNRLIFLVAGASAALISVSSAVAPRTFTSADGSKTMQATLTDCAPSAGTATIRRADGKTMTIPIASLSAADKEYIEGWYQSTMAGRRIAVNIRGDESKAAEAKTNNAKIRKFNSHFDINLRNNGDGAFEDIEVKYRVFYYRDGSKGQKRQELNADGGSKITRLASRSEESIKTSPVEIVSIRPLPASQCSGGT